MNLFTPPNTLNFPGEKNEAVANRLLFTKTLRFLHARVTSVFIGCAVLILTAIFQNNLNAQCSPCIINMVHNAGSDPWSAECYLNQNCLPQGNPCQANDVELTGVFIADSMGNPVGACSIGSMVTVLLWGNFTNHTNANRYAVRTNTEVFINGVCNVELNSCSFDVLPSGSTAAALVGSFTYICGQTVELRRTVIGWSSSVAQCSNPLGSNYNDVCSEYNSSHCSRNFEVIQFLAVNFSYDCGVSTETTTEVCFNDLTIGGTPPYTWAWDFGDGGMSTLQNPCHTYSATSGTFVVTLTVTDSNGTSAGAFLTIDLDSLQCCDLIESSCPTMNGGFFTCLEDVPAPDTNLVVVIDSCGPITTLVTDEFDGFGCRMDTLTITRRYIITDGINLDTCIQIFKVLDDQAPIFSCPPAVTVQCASQIPPADVSLIMATDNCPGSIIATFVSDVNRNQTCANRFTVIRTYRVSDDCLNSATCTQTITVFDNTAPSITCPGNVTVNCASQVPAPNPGSVTSSDFCGGTGTVTHLGDVTVNQTCANRFTINRTYRSTDACGNSATCNQTITVFDNTPPTIINCAPNVTVQCVSDVPPVNISLVSASDNCGGSTTITHAGDAISGVFCTNRLIVTRTYRAVDACGNSATCNQTITVFDNTPLTFLTCLVNLNLQCVSQIPAPSTVGITTFDNCSGTPTILFAGDITLNQTCANRFNITRTYRAVDECGNSATCTQSISVFDSSLPSIICPTNVTVQCANQVPAPNPGSVTSTDNCGGGATVTHVGDVMSNQTCDNRFNITRTYRAMDACGNSASCTQTITVFDDVVPFIMCPGNVTVQCANSVPAPNPGSVTSSDFCGGTATVTHVGDVMSGQTCTNRFTLTRTYRSTDACGNSATCAQTITVFDDTPPFIMCPANVTVQCATLVPAPAISTVTSSDNCGGAATVTHLGDVTSGQTCDNRFIVTRTYRAMDVCGNSATCNQIITVFDNTPPAIMNCPANVTVQCASQVPTPDIAGITSTENCSGTATITHAGDVMSGLTCTNRFIVTRTYRAVDACGNSSSCTQTITVFDNTAPSILNCPVNVTVQCASLVPGPNPAGITSTDNCGGAATVTHVGDVMSNMTCTNRFNITRTYRAMDACGNSATCTQTITVFDSTPPALTCPGTVTVQCASQIPAPNVEQNFTTTDNCGVTTISFGGDVTVNQTCVNRFNVIRTYRATDDCGNSASCIQTILVFDSTPPFIMCPGNVTVQCANSVPAPNITSVTSTDNCGGGATVTHVGDVMSNMTCTNRFNITRTYQAVDACGNSATCAQTITVFDDTPPSILNCPGNVTVQCANAVPAPSTSITATDNCGGGATVTFLGDVMSNQTCTNRFNIARTYRATDACGNSSSCTQTITVFDSTPPGFTCPQNVLVVCASDVPPAAPGSITATDNCGGGATVTHVGDVMTAQTCANRFNIIRTYQATDACGNSATCNQTISVFDNVPPSLTCPGNVTVQCANLLPAPDVALVSSSDNCGGTATITHVGDVMSNMTCTNRFNVTRTYRATDACGNSATCTQTITVFDSTPPALTCPGNVTVQCASLIPAPNVEQNFTTTDNCGVTSISFGGDVTVNQTCVNRFNVIRTYRATDDCGNSASCTQTIIVFDSTPPFIMCSGNVTVQCANSVPAPSTTSVTSTDNCGGGATVTHVGDVMSNMTCTNRFTITRTYQSVDGCGNSATCTQIITVFDDTPPTILNCPGNVTVQCANAVPAPSTSVTATDNCGGGATVTHVGDVMSNQTCANRFNITRTYRATDACGNSSSCTQTITVFDSTPPGFTCPQNLLFTCASEVPAPAPGSITATDNCGGGATVTHVGDVMTGQTCANRFNIIRTYQATDACGNSATCTQTISVFDNVPPSLTCPGNVTVQCANLLPAPDVASVMSSDNCGGTATVTHVGDVMSNMTCTNRFNVTRTYRATDACGNSATCTQTITVFDSTPPALTCPGNVTVQCASQIPAPNVEQNFSTTDNCGVASISFGGDVTVNQTCVNRFNVIRTYRATDDCGNSASCTQTIIVFDNTPPSIVCPQNVTVQCANAVPAPSTTSITTSTDNCGGATTITHVGDVMSNMTCTNRFNITRTYRATDACGNSATCSQIITVFDSTPPSLTCPSNITVQCTEQIPAPNTTLVTATDLCGGMATITHVSDSNFGQSCTNRYNVLRTYRATDECGNSATCTQTITVFDNIPPVLNCPNNVTVMCILDIPPVNPALVTSSDNCTSSITLSHLNDVVSGVVCLNRFNVIRTYVGSDDCGNSSSCTQVITVFDNTPPALTCPANTTVECASLVPIPDPALVTSTDNCIGGSTVSFVSDGISNQTCGNRFNLIRTYRAIDRCGNSATCTQTITVFDSTPPALTCPGNVTVQCANLVPTPDPALVSSTDNCAGTATVTHVGDVVSNQTCTNRFNITRTYRATDACGNSATCTQTITVFDNTAPFIMCPENVTVQCANSVPVPSTTSVTSSDNCGGGATVTHVGDVMSGQTCANRFIVSRTYRATDACGNSASCTQTITVFDNTPPFIMCPENVTVQCANTVPVPSTTSVTSSDNCGGSATITHVGDVMSGQTCANRFILTRTYRATDACGNSATCAQTITVFDNTPPTLTCPGNVTVQCASLVPMPNTTSVTSTDNCGGTATVTHVGDVMSNMTCVNRFNITRTYRATDACGNSATCTQTITVFDNTAPALTCPGNVTVQCASDIPGQNVESVTTTDNCGVASVSFGGDVTVNQTCVNRFNVIRTYRATDDCGNSATCTQTIIVFDSTPPALTCPMNVTVQCANLVPAPAVGTVTSTDNCAGTATVTHVGDVMSNMTCVNRFNITRTYRATDACGNSATCTQTITVFDNTAPTLTCPANVTVQCANLVPMPSTTSVTSSDNCGGTATVTHVGDVISNQTCVNRFTISRTYRATDECGNSASCTQTITVFDNTAPTLTCPANVTVQCANLVPMPSPTSVTSSDNCGGTATVTHVGDAISNQVCVNRFTISRTYRATDECGNSASCTQTITVFDNTAPTLTCPANVTVQCATLVPMPSTTSVTSSDNCGGAATVTHVSDVISNQTCTNRFDLIRTYRATDECGNSASCTQTITVFDNTAPTLTCPANVTVQCASLIPPQNVEAVTTTDNCGGASISFGGDVTVNQICVNRFTVMRTYRATDVCGNSASCTQTITVFDNTAPTFLTCPANITVQCANLVPATVDPAQVSATDNCGGSSTVTLAGDVISNQTCANRFTVTRTYRATDDCGNSSSCTQTIIVFDDTAPMISACPANVTVQCANLVPAPNPALVTATDNCAGAATTSFVNDAVSNQSCANRFTVTRTYRATDACGNSASCTQTITVFDNTAPSITCPVNVTVQCANQVPPVNTVGITSSDNCGGSASITHAGDVISNMTCVNRFVVTRTYRATDACGNSASCSQIITVFDNTAPSITCPANVTVQCASLVPAVNTGSVTSSDNCGGTTSISHLGDVITNMTCANRFVLRRTYRASDLCGNSATCVQTITVFDNTPPTITFTDPLLLGIPNGGTVEVQCFGQDPEWDLPTFGPGSVSAVDNCAGNVAVTFTQVLQDEGNCPVDGYIVLYRLTWTATDVCGNSRTAQVFLALIDEIPPVIHNVPDDITVNCNEIPEPPALVFATDECLCACIITYEQIGPFPGCQDGQVVMRRWTAEDDCGNVTVEIQNITLIDLEGPEIIIQVPELNGLPDGTILDYTCNEGGIPDIFDDLDAQSAISPVSCGSAGMITFDSKVDIANNCEFWGYIEQRTFHWVAVDLCGNKNDLTIIVRLIDTEPPILIGVPEMTCVDDPLLALVDAIDNCGNPHVRFFDVQIPNPCGVGNAPATRRTYEAFDDCGNITADTAILIPNDHAHPIMVFVNPQLDSLDFGDTLIVDCAKNDGNYTEFGPDDVTFVDDCMFGVTVTFTETVIEARDCSNGVVAILELRWLATDICGNAGEALITAEVVDHTSPVFVDFDPEVTVGCNDSIPETEATDNCGDVTVTYEDIIIPGLCPYEYEVKRTVIATDPCGNTTSGQQLIHVGDGSGPTIEGVVPEICDDLSMQNVTAFDECAGQFVEVTVTSDTLDTHCIGGIVIRRTYSAVDICGNVASITQDVILGDDTPPLIHVPSNSIIQQFLDVPGLHLVLLSQVDIIKLLDDLDDGSVFILDDCDQLIIPEFTLEITHSPNCILDGFFEHRVYTWVATDACGNSSSISFFVNIMDNVGPNLTGVPADATIICQDLPAPPVVLATGFSFPINIEFSEIIEPGDGPGIFIVTRIWRAIDPCGNVTTFTQHILWIPNSLLDCEIVVPEMVECNSHGVVIGSNVSGGQGAIDYMWEITGEKCFIQSGQNTPEITIYVGWSTVQIRLTVTDAFGCSNVCTASLDCVDSALNPLTGLPVGNVETTVLPETSNPSADQTPLATLNRINLWPNPANGTVNLSFDANVNQEVQFTLLNFLGQVVLDDEIDATKGLNTRKIDVAKIPEGSYLMQVQSESGMYTKIITVIHQ